MANDQLAAPIISDLNRPTDMRQALAAVLGRERQALPAARDELRVGLLEALWAW